MSYPYTEQVNQQYCNNCGGHLDDAVRSRKSNGELHREKVICCEIVYKHAARVGVAYRVTVPLLLPVSSPQRAEEIARELMHQTVTHARPGNMAPLESEVGYISSSDFKGRFGAIQFGVVQYVRANSPHDIRWKTARSVHELHLDAMLGTAAVKTVRGERVMMEKES